MYSEVLLIIIKMMKWVDRFKSLPKSTKNLLVVGILLALVAALPLFIWAISTQKFLFSQKAQVATGEPTSTPTTSPLACTLDAQVCPDGSTVGRIPPNCDFAPCPTSTPPAIYCPSVTVTGATYEGIFSNQIRYSLESSGSATIHANTIPANLPVNWKAQFSSQLPNGGSFANNYVATTLYTAPANTSGSDQGVEIRGDISEYPSPWIYCPPFTIVVKPVANVEPKSFGILFKFDGVNDGSADGAKVSVRFVGNNIDLITGDPQPTAHYVTGSAGVYRLSVTMDGSYLPAGNNYAVVLKGEKHGQAKFCKSQGQTSYCTASTQGEINIPNTSETISLNFTGFPLPAGDTIDINSGLQDGVINFIDYDRIFAILSKPSLSADDLKVGDLNYDNKVNVQDMFLLLKSLSARYDEY